jgi:hypothetical protein
LITIGEYIAFHQSEIFNRLQLIARTPKISQVIDNEEPPEEFNREIERLMRHDSFERRNGAIKQRGWGRG